jgi:subtilisin-like proprotein convertase family protein
LTAPSGKKVTLLSKKNDHHDDIHLTLDSEKDTVLAPFKGETITGDWQLTVKDLWEQDMGRLDKFGLTFTFAPTEEVIEAEALVNQPIPDLYSSGITSTIACNAGKTVRRLEVGVDITHTYFGDLQLTLISPSGTRALLKAADVQYRGSIPKSFDSDATQSLKAIHGERAVGNWRLEVCDMIRSDTGTLDRWRLRLVVE